MADVNGDGKPDALLANQDGNNLGVLLGDGKGGFTLKPNSPGTGGAGPFSMAVADVNGDGKPDALVANADSGTLGVLLGDGKGGFTRQPNPPATNGSGFSGPLSVAIADVNGDGKPDALVTNSISDNLGVLLGDGKGGFTLKANSPATGGSSPYSMVVADVNGDGKSDVLVAHATTRGTLGVLLGDGKGGFALQANSPATGGSAFSIAVADVNGDGKPDALVANTISDDLGVLLGDGKGSFTLQANPPATGGEPYSVAIADVNGDGKLDALVTNTRSGTLGMLLGDGKGGFDLQASALTTGGSNPISIALADVNGDGKPDALVANVSGNTLGVLLNTTVYVVLTSGSTTLAAQVRAYPNPAQGQLTISRPTGNTASAVLLNATGQQLRTISLPTTETTVNLEGLPAGMYALRMTLAGGSTVIQRVVVQ